MRKVLLGVTMACLILTAILVCAAGVSGCSMIPQIPDVPEQVSAVVKNFRPMEPVCVYAYDGKVVDNWQITNDAGTPILSGKITMTIAEWKSLMGKSAAEVWKYLYEKATECVALGKTTAGGGQSCQ